DGQRVSGADRGARRREVGIAIAAGIFGGERWSAGAGGAGWGEEFAARRCTMSIAAPSMVGERMDIPCPRSRGQRDGSDLKSALARNLRSRRRFGLVLAVLAALGLVTEGTRPRLRLNFRMRHSAGSMRFR